MLTVHHRRTKIVCTIGPSSNSPEMMRDLMVAGMNVARLNFSHGSHASHQTTCADLRRAAADTDRNLGIMMDLQGPKIRTGTLIDGTPLLLNPGDTIAITTDEIVGTQHLISTTYAGLPGDVKRGDSIFLADGVLEFAVDRVEDNTVHCVVVHGGHLGEHKGINLPGVDVSAPALTPKDIQDLEFGLNHLDIDFVALSFVRTAEDILDLKRRIEESGRTLAIVAKIERPEALENFDAILDATDCIMLARGDLGVEIPLHDVPQIQKELIGKCNDVGVPVITATQMLESMIGNARPTRAEVADVANAIYDGTDAIMLSGETASGEYPLEAVSVMANIANKADTDLNIAPPHARIVRMRESGIRSGQGSYGDAIGQAACRTAHAIGAKRIVCFTKLGYTAALIARYRPTVPISVITMDESIRHRCALIWGVDSALTVEPCDTDDLGRLTDQLLLENNLAEPGDTVVLAGGVPLAIRTRTNMMKLHTVGENTESRKSH